MDWMIVVLMTCGVVCSIAFASYLHRKRRDRRAFNEFFAAVLIYELGDQFASSLPYNELVRLMPCPPEETNSIVGFLESRGVLEVEYGDGAKRVLLGIAMWAVFDRGNWRMSQTPQARERFDRALDVARSKFAAAA